MPITREFSYDLPDKCLTSGGELKVSDESVRLALADFYTAMFAIGSKQELSALAKLALKDSVLMIREGSCVARVELSGLHQLLTEYNAALKPGCATCKHLSIEQVGDRQDDDFTSCGLYESIWSNDGSGSDRETHKEFRVYSRANSPRVTKHLTSPCQNYQRRNTAVTMALDSLIASIENHTGGKQNGVNSAPGLVLA